MPEHPDLQETRLFGDAPSGTDGLPSGATCAIGDLLAGRFRIIRFIARGGMGELYEAEDLELGERVALKAMRPEIAADEDANRRFRREVQLARQVTHPNICRIFDLFQHQPPGGRPPVVFVTMELLDGETVADRLRRTGRFSPREALPIVVQMADALSAAHQAGIVHRDFKSSNVMLLDARSPGEAPRAVVTDFGIAYRVGEAGAPHQPALLEVVGTPDYMAPEQLEGGDVTAMTDIYALGVVMYEMVTGERPFSFGAPLASALRDLRDAPPSPRSLLPDLPLAWDLCIGRCLARRPEHRFADAQAVAAAVGGHPERDRGSDGLRSLAVVIALAVVVVTLATAVGVLVSRGRETTAPVAADAVAPRPVPRRSVAVLGFRNVAGRDDAAWLSTAFAEMLTTELGAGEALRTVPGEHVDRMKVELALVDAESYAGDTLMLVRENLGADLVAYGAFVTVGTEADPMIRLDARLQDARTGQMLAQVSETGRESTMLDMVSRVGRTLRERMGLTPLSASAADAVRASQPASPEAARLYAEGVARLRRFDALAARDLLEKAAAADARSPLPHSALAMAWSALGYDSRARDAARRAFELSSALSREERLGVEATYREMTAEWKQAVALYRSLATFFPDNIEYTLRLANAEIASGAAKEGLATIETLRAQAPSASDPRIDLAEAAAAETLSDFRRMRSAAQRAVVAGTAQRAKLLVARARLLEGIALFHVGQLPAAVAAIEEARTIYAGAGDRLGVARALNSLATTVSESGDPTTGVALYEKGLTIARAIGNQDLAARVLNNLAIQARHAGTLEAALRLNREAIAIRRELGDRTNLATSLNNLGNVLLDQGDLAGAARHYREAADIHREVGDRRGVARTLHNAGVALLFQGELAPARAVSEEALSIRRTIDDPASVASSLNGLGEVVALQGELGAARRMFTEALEIQRRLNNQRPMGYILYQLADLARLEGDLAQARRLHTEALDLRTALGERGTAAESRVALAEIDLDENRPAGAERLARAAYAAFAAQRTRHTQASAQAVLARALLMQGRRAAAAREAQRARALVRDSTNTLTRIPVLIASGLVDGLTGTNPQATIARASLRSLQQQARERGIARYELEARLALAQIEARFSPEVARAQLADIEKDARARGLALYARRAAQ